MPTSIHETLLLLLLTVLFLLWLVELAHIDQPAAARKASRRGPRPLRPRTPDDCLLCQDAAEPTATAAQAVIPYTQLKSRRGRKKSINTSGYACPYPKCRYFNNPNPTVHALVGYGHHGRGEPIQDFYCQACQHKFSARRHTALYRLKAPAARVAQVLHAVAEGLSPQAAARVFNVSEASIRCWITRAGLHSRSLHDRLMRSLHLTHVQLDELRLKVRGMTESAWLWVACDARTKLIPAFALGSRTQEMAHHLVHEVMHHLAPSCVPVFSSDGLALYFYALTAHFGAWADTRGDRGRSWMVIPQLLYGQVIKRYRRKRIVEVRQHVLLGTPETFRQALRAAGFSGRIQTAFIERLNLTIRRSIAGLARRSWSTANSLGELALQFEWWRAVYHFARPHASLREVVSGSTSPARQVRYRKRTPAQVAGLTNCRWTVQKLLTCPAPPLLAGK